MAYRLARIFGTEEDKVNCAFYYKIGACRHGDRCTRLHNKPLLSQTVLLKNMYVNPAPALALAEGKWIWKIGQEIPEEILKETIRHFEDFYEEVFIELVKYGEVEELNVCDNIGEHIVGNVYVKYYNEEDAKKAYSALNGRYYAGRQINAEYSPVTDFREAKCRQFDQGCCERGGYCNFMHLKHVSRTFKRSLFREMYDKNPEFWKQKKE